MQRKRRQTAKTPRRAKERQGLVVVFKKTLAFFSDLGALAVNPSYSRGRAVYS
jgi:hypothetical protein